MTSEDGTRALERPFLVLATQNPIEYEGTYPLPEAQLDRFLLRISVGYPDREAELELLARRLERGRDEVELRRSSTARSCWRCSEPVEQVHADAAILEYAVDLVTATRESPQVQVGRALAARSLLKLARARAALEGRDFVTPDDVKRIALPALAHRIMLRPELWIQRVDRGGRRARPASTAVPCRPPASPTDDETVPRAASACLRGARGDRAHRGARLRPLRPRGARDAVRGAPRRRVHGRTARARRPAGAGPRARSGG